MTVSPLPCGVRLPPPGGVAVYAAVVLLLLASVGEVSARQGFERLDVIVLDVGHGTAVAVRSPDGQVALVDAGPSDALVPQLRTLGIHGLDLVVASNARPEHLGGMTAVLDRLPVLTYLEYGAGDTTSVARSVAALRDRLGILHRRATDQVISLGPASLRVLPPLRGEDGAPGTSVGILVEYGRFRVLLPGDAGARQLASWMALGIPPLSVLMAPAHGHADGASRDWLAATDPQMVVISVGRANTDALPDRSALRAFAAGGRPVYRTDHHGRVIVRGARDGSFTVSTDHAMVADGAQPAFR